MPAPLSIVIPTLNAERQLPETAAHLMEGLDSGLVRGLVISDGGSVDATISIADDLGATIVTGDAGRGGQMGRGAYAADGAWFLFLHADTHLSPGWAAVIASHIKNNSHLAGYCRLGFRASGFRPRFFEVGANLRSRWGLPYGDQGLLISRRLYEQIGGYAEIPLMEDVEIVGRLKGRIIALDTTASTDAARYQTYGWYGRGVRNMWTLLRYRFGASPEKLAIIYNR